MVLLAWWVAVVWQPVDEAIWLLVWAGDHYREIAATFVIVEGGGWVVMLTLLHVIGQLDRGR